jgi:branched-chain amino acid transport system substrate-binding protein
VVILLSIAFIPLQSTQSGAATKRTVSVGIICGCTGALASSTSTSPQSYESWANAVNAKGGINGYKINVIVKQDQASPPVGLQDAQTLIQVDHVVALVDATDTETAWAAYAKQKGVPVVGGFNLSVEDITSSNFFASGTTEDAFTLAQVLAAKKVHATKTAEFYCSEDPLCAEIVPVLKSTAAANGVSVVTVSEISAAQPNYTAQCLTAKQDGATSVTIGESVTAVEAMAADCSRQGYFPWYEIADGGVSKSFTSALGLNTKSFGYETGLPFFDTTAPAARKMIAAIKKTAPQILSNPNYNQDNVSMYASAVLFGQALQAGTAGKSGPVTTEEIYKGPYTIHNDTLGGLSPPLTFKPNQPNPVDCWYWIGMSHGHFTTPYGLTPVCKATS